ncbi:MAG: hypothetical protein EP347_03400 [Alphaproteobacteria bacterium]|nr:MAG: hypothetical protein EP347_03400 [Alphaproteobacteria bacterium]
MILRRLSKHLLTQDWAAAFIDFIIVVAGIFVGLQVDSWNETRIERNLETRYLERLQQELEADIAHYAFGQSLVEERLDQINFLYQVIDTPQLAQSRPEDFVVAIEKAAWKSYLPIDRNVYSEMASTGNMALIRSEHLRETLSTYYSEVDHWELIIDSTGAQIEYVHETAGILDKDILTLIENNNGSWEDSNAYTIDPERARAIASEFATRAAAIKWLPRIYQQHVLVNRVLDQHSKHAAELIKEIEAELKKR